METLDQLRNKFRTSLATQVAFPKEEAAPVSKAASTPGPDEETVKSVPQPESRPTTSIMNAVFTAPGKAKAYKGWAMALTRSGSDFTLTLTWGATDTWSALSEPGTTWNTSSKVYESRMTALRAVRERAGERKAHGYTLRNVWVHDTEGSDFSASIDAIMGS